MTAVWIFSEHGTKLEEKGEERLVGNNNNNNNNSSRSPNSPNLSVNKLDKYNLQ